MANQKITVVYQDCILCGDRGKKIGKIVASKGIRLHKVSFASDEGRELIAKRFAATLAEIIAKPKKARKAKKAKVAETESA